MANKKVFIVLYIYIYILMYTYYQKMLISVLDIAFQALWNITVLSMSLFLSVWGYT